MLENQRKTINGTEYEITQLPFKRGKRVLWRLLEVAGPALSKAFEQVPAIEGKGLGDIEVSKLLPTLSIVVQELFKRLGEADVDFITSELAAQTQISTESGKWVPLTNVMELHFGGNYGEYFQWLAFAIKVNFLGFIDGWGGLSGLLEKVPAAVGSPSQNTSTGTPTELHPASDTAAH